MDKNKDDPTGLLTAGPEGLVLLMLGMVVGAIAAALSFTLGRRSSS